MSSGVWLEKSFALDFAFYGAGHRGVVEQGEPVAVRLPDQLPGQPVQGELAAGGVFDLLAAEAGQDQAVEDVDAELISGPAPGCVRGHAAPESGWPAGNEFAGVCGGVIARPAIPA